MPKDGKGLLPVDAMAAELAAQKSGRGRSKIYKEISDEHRAALVSADIRRKADALAEQKGRVELSDINQVKARAQEYLSACAESGTFPSILGLSALGFGCSRQWVNDYLRANPNSESAQYIEKLKDAFADILVNASLGRSADSTMGIFVLKNCAGFRDRYELEPVTTAQPLGDTADRAALEARIAGSVVVDDD